MALPFPSPTIPQDDRRKVLLGYLAYFRSALLDKLFGLSEADLRRAHVPSGWTPLELLNHLTHVERRWLVWGFEGEPVADPWGDTVDDRWHVPASVPLAELTAALAAQASVTQEVVRRHDLGEVGAPSERWDGAPPATLERVLLHLVQEYARHVGHLDVVRELLDGRVGE
jgi:uncharacterized damage-inducible protein DinB